MPIIGLNFSQVSGEKKNSIKGRINVKQDIKIVSLEKEQMNISSSEDTLKVGFEFKVDYAPEVGQISLKGNILYMTEPKLAESLLKNWKKNNKIDDERLLLNFFNAIISKSNVKALLLADDLGLPPHVRMPRLTSQPKK